ncbi:hypothetical protein LTR75_005206 [Friedmanniomyces endolithicus]|nr:hypothetical protein LTR75_005206 [Friedmanniomyces endolithicus]
MDFPYAFWEQGADSWLRELDFFTTEAEPQLQSLADDSAIERAKPWILDHFRRRSRPSSPIPRGVDISWYSSPPKLQMYDKEVLNVLLNVARRHLGTTFELYANYEAQGDSEPELCLAMAAVGALYLGAECASAALKTFILLSIYSICSGDKRSYEFVEAFHLSMLQALRYCGQLISSDPDATTLRDIRSMSEAMELIECYHVLLLQHPPCAIPAPLRSMTSPGQNRAALDRPGTPHDLPGHAQGAHGGIAILSAFAWAASPQGEELSCRRQLWRSEFVELAMERWMGGKIFPLSESDFPSMLIYHLMHLRLKVNLDFLQKSARQFTNPPSHTANESSEHEILESYIRGLLFAVAIWHAQAMLSMVQENVGMPEDISKRTATSTSSRPMSEPPRLPYCIYFSTLIAWYGEFENSGYRSLARDACIKQGIRILGRLKKRVARVFILALRELLPDERWPGAACLIHEMYHLSCGALYSRDYTVV